MPSLTRQERDDLLAHLRAQFEADGVDHFDAMTYAFNIVALFPLW